MFDWFRSKTANKAEISQERRYAFRQEVQPAMEIHLQPEVPEFEMNAKRWTAALDFRNMILAFSIVPDRSDYSAYSFDDFYLIRHSDNVWQMRLSHIEISEDTKEEAQCYQPRQWLDYLRAEASEDPEELALLQNGKDSNYEYWKTQIEWRRIPQPLDQHVDVAFRRCCEFFARNPGLSPELEENDFAEGRLNPSVVWVPPKHM